VGNSALPLYELRNKIPLPMILGQNEIKCCEEGASHLHEFVAVGGTLCLTNKRLYFRSNAQAVQQHELVVELKSISGIELCKTMFLNPNGLAILLKDGNMEHFIVDDRQAWKERIQKEMRQMA
jgi:hypothetical protein